MSNATKSSNRRGAFTLVEMIVVIAIILVIAALAAAFMPRVQDSTNLLRSVDQFEQWLLTAKMRAKHDQLATGIRFIPDPVNPGMYSEFQYIQQPEPISGGTLVFVPTGTPQPAGSAPYQMMNNGTYYVVNGGLCLQPNPTAAPQYGLGPLAGSQPPLPIPKGQVQIYNFDPTLNGTPSPTQWLVQAGDYLDLQNSGIYLIAGVVTPTPSTTPTTNLPNWKFPNVSLTTLELGSFIPSTYYTNPSFPFAPMVLNNTAWLPTPPPLVFQSQYEQNLSVPAPTANFRIVRQPRIFVGESPLQMPNNFAVDTMAPTNNILPGPSGYIEILFSPSGAVIGANAGSGKLYAYIHDITQTPPDPNRGGIVAVQTRTGFIGAYQVAPLPLPPTAFAEEGRESGL